MTEEKKADEQRAEFHRNVDEIQEGLKAAVETRVSTPPSKLRARCLRIRTDAMPKGQRAKGQDTHVVAVLEDGTEVPINCFKRVDWHVDGRSGYCTASLVAEGVELDVEGAPIRPVAASLLNHINVVEAENKRLREELRVLGGTPVNTGVPDLEQENKRLKGELEDLWQTHNNVMKVFDQYTDEKRLDRQQEAQAARACAATIVSLMLEWVKAGAEPLKQVGSEMVFHPHAFSGGAQAGPRLGSLVRRYLGNVDKAGTLDCTPAEGPAAKDLFMAALDLYTAAMCIEDPGYRERVLGGFSVRKTMGSRITVADADQAHQRQQDAARLTLARQRVVELAPVVQDERARQQ